MLDSFYYKRFKKTGIFVAIFTLLFIIFVATLKYTLPFVLGFLIALFTRNFNAAIQKKLKISSGFTAIITTTAIFLTVGLLVIVAISKITTEIILILTKFPSIDKITIYIEFLVKKIIDITGQINPAVLEKVYEYLQQLLSQLWNFTIVILNTVLSVALQLPNLLLIMVITFIATYLFSKDFRTFRTGFYSIFTTDGKKKMQAIVESGISMAFGYVKAYSLVVFISFLQVLIGFSLLKVNFALILSILCALFDLLPIIGMIMIFVPLIIYYFIIDKTVAAILLIALFVLVQVVRQIIEPKIVSHTLELHPLLILGAIFIGLKVHGFLGIIYFISLMVTYKVLVKVNVL
ncbi:sporulation integral membrane protein YtvI [Tissierella creatinini]|nr:sporulation integral membrane protein YtvI [Tissierella creatinini]TJX67487.1 sporulation integral membrane protein YtvI [Soehngenia saccharolytica]